MQDDLEYKKENQNSWYGLILYVKSTLLRFDMPYFVANMDKIKKAIYVMYIFFFFSAVFFPLVIFH